MHWLNYHHLYYFWITAKEGSITGASKKLGIGQPTISTQIKNLEDALNQSVFSREGKRLNLTETGRVVLDYANQNIHTGQ